MKVVSQTCRTGSQRLVTVLGNSVDHPFRNSICVCLELRFVDGASQDAAAKLCLEINMVSISTTNLYNH